MGRDASPAQQSLLHAAPALPVGPDLLQGFRCLVSYPFLQASDQTVDKLIGDIDNSSWQPAGVLDKDTGSPALSQLPLAVLAKRQRFQAPKLVCIQKGFWAAQRF